MVEDNKIFMHPSVDHGCHVAKMVVEGWDAEPLVDQVVLGPDRYVTCTGGGARKICTYHGFLNQLLGR